MRHALIGFAALVAASAAGIAPSSAQGWQGRGTWCTQPPIGGGSMNCYYYSERQCRGSLGPGGFRSCVPNPTAAWERQGYKFGPELQPDYAKGRRTEREGR
jgi:hypothetical protein